MTPILWPKIAYNSNDEEVYFDNDNDDWGNDVDGEYEKDDNEDDYTYHYDDYVDDKFSDANGDDVKLMLCSVCSHKTTTVERCLPRDRIPFSVRTCKY